MSCVLDASVTLSWLFERATEAERLRSIAILERLERAPAVVPVLWMAEVLNAIVVGERRKAISVTQSADFLERLSALNIETDPVAATTRRDAVLGVARELSISAHDATYVELAMRLGRPFGTFDARLRKAAESSGLTVL